MNNRRITNILLVLGISVFLFGAGYQMGKYSTPLEPATYSANKTQGIKNQNIDFQQFWDTWQKLEEKYVDKSKLDRQKMMYGAIKGMVAAVDDVETGIGTSDTDATVLAAPTGISLTQANRDVDQDGKVDIALRTTFSGAVANAAGYEVWWEDNAGQTASVRADSGVFWFIANTVRSYRVRWRTINWVGTPGAWSSYTSYVTPNATTGAPAAPVSFSASITSLGIITVMNQQTEFDYSHTEYAIRTSNTTPNTSDIFASTVGYRSRLFLPPIGGSFYIFARNINTSGLASSWVLASGSPLTQPLVDGTHIENAAINQARLVAGAAGNAVVTNSATTMGSVNPGSGWTRTLLVMSWKATASNAGVTVTLGGYSSTFDFVNGDYYCMTTVETGGGSFNASKSGGSIANCQICAVGIY